MAKGQTLKRLANLRRLVQEVRAVGEVDVYNVIEIFDCSDSGARKYLAELVDNGVLVFKGNAPTANGGQFGARIYELTPDEDLIREFVGNLDPDSPTRQMPEPTRTLTGYPAERAKTGVFAQFQHQGREQRKVFRDPLVAFLFGPAGVDA